MTDEDRVLPWTGRSAPTRGVPSEEAWPHMKVLFNGECLCATGLCTSCGGASVGWFHADAHSTESLQEMCATCGAEHRMYAGDLSRAPDLPEAHDEEVLDPDLVDDPQAATPKAHRMRRLVAEAARRGVALLLPGQRKGTRALLPGRAGSLGSEAGDGIFNGMADEEPYDPRGPRTSSDAERWIGIAGGSYEALVPVTGRCWGPRRCLLDEDHDGECRPADETTLEGAVDAGLEVRRAEG